MQAQADLARAFDHVGRGDLWAKAVEAKYPRDISSLTVAACRWERRLEHGRAPLQLPQAGRGIVPGSPVANALGSQRTA